MAITETETLIGLGLTERLGVTQTESRGALPAAKGLPGVFGLGVSTRNSADARSACFGPHACEPGTPACGHGRR